MASSTQLTSSQFTLNASTADDLVEEESAPLEDLISAEKEVVLSTGLLLLLLVLMFALFGSHVFRKLRFRSIQMPIIATAFGLLLGAVIKYSLAERTILERILAFNEDVFFILLLPPIIFESGFGLSDRRAHHMFKNFGAILWLAFFTTLLSFALTGSLMFVSGFVGISNSLSWRESFAFGALISSTDPVSVLGLFKDLNAHSTMYALVSGESLLNDAVSIVLYRAIAGQGMTSIWMSVASFGSTFFFSFSIGLGVGLIAALIYKYMDFHKEENKILEASLLLLFPWVSYLISDGASQSGIVSIMFCGITMAKYTYPNLSSLAKNASKSVFGSLALLAETVVFVFLGLAPFSFSQKHATLGLFLSTLVVVSVSRCISVYSTCWIINWFRSTRSRIPDNFQHTLVLCGIRGAIAFALALRAKHDFGGVNGSALLSATLFYALFTILIVGVLLVRCFEKLKVFQVEDSPVTAPHQYLPVTFPRPDGGGGVIHAPRTRESLTTGKCGCVKRGILMADEFMKKVFTHQVSTGSTEASESWEDDSQQGPLPVTVGAQAPGAVVAVRGSLVVVSDGPFKEEEDEESAVQRSVDPGWSSADEDDDGGL